MDPVPESFGFGVFGGRAKDMDVVRSSGTSGWRVNDFSWSWVVNEKKISAAM